MTVTYKQLSEVIDCHPASTDDLTVHKNLLQFNLTGATYVAAVELALTDDEYFDRQNLEIRFWFLDKNGDLLNLAILPRPVVIELLYSLCGEWGKLEPSFQGEVTSVCYSRRIDICEYDVECALAGDDDSELLRSLERLDSESVYIGQALELIASGRVSSIDDLKLLVQHEGGQC